MPTLQFHGWNDPIFAFGDTGIAGRHKTAFLCSRHYPAAAVLRSYDWAKEIRERGACVISGFHSALERDVLDILLRGRQPLILAAARGLPKRYPADIKQAINQGRLLVVSPYPASVSRITAITARKRNEFMLAVADRIVIGSMSQNSALAEALRGVSSGKEVICLAI